MIFAHLDENNVVINRSVQSEAPKDDRMIDVTADPNRGQIGQSYDFKTGKFFDVVPTLTLEQAKAAKKHELGIRLMTALQATVAGVEWFNATEEKLKALQNGGVAGESVFVQLGEEVHAISVQDAAALQEAWKTARGLIFSKHLKLLADLGRASTIKAVQAISTALLILFMAFLPVQAQTAQVGVYIRAGFSSITSPVANRTYVFDSTTGRLSVWNGSTWQQISTSQQNLVATVPPTGANDNTQGYSVGSFWYDTVAQNFYTCADATTGSAVWFLLTGASNSPAQQTNFLQTADISAGLIASGVIPAVPGSTTLSIPLPSGVAYVNGTRTVVPPIGSHAYTASKWTFDFVESDGTRAFYTQPYSTTAPSDPGLLSEVVVTDGTTVTAVNPSNTISATLFNLLRPIPSGDGLPLITDHSKIGNLAYEKLPLTGIDSTGVTAGAVLLNNGTTWGASSNIPPTSIDSAGATLNQVITWNGTNWAPASAVTGGSINVFTSGNLNPWFTTSVANPTTAPAQSFSPTGNAGDIAYFSASNIADRLAIGTTGQALTVASGNPAWGSIGIAGGGTGGSTQQTAANGVLAFPSLLTGATVYFDGANWVQLPAGANGNVLTLASGVPAWTTPTFSGTVTSVNLTNSGVSFLNATGGPVTSSGTLQESAVCATGDLIYGSAANTFSNRTIGTAGQFLGVLSGVPAWQSAVTSVNHSGTGLGFLSFGGGPITGAGTLTLTANCASGDLIYGSATNVLSKLPIDSNGKQLQIVSNLPAWVTPTGGTVTSVNNSNSGISFMTTGGGPVTGSGTLTESASGTLGDLIYFSATNVTSNLPVGTAVQVIGNVAGVPAWVTPRFATSAKTSNFAASPQNAYTVNTTGGAVAATLPTAVGIDGQEIFIVLIAGTNALTLNTTSGQTISGQAGGAVSTTTLWNCYRLMAIGGNWVIEKG